jgi:hypothetical protein
LQPPPHPDIEIVIPSDMPLLLSVGQRVAVLRPGLQVRSRSLVRFILAVSNIGFVRFRFSSTQLAEARIESALDGAYTVRFAASAAAAGAAEEEPAVRVSDTDVMPLSYSRPLYVFVFPPHVFSLRRNSQRHDCHHFPGGLSCSSPFCSRICVSFSIRVAFVVMRWP